MEENNKKRTDFTKKESDFAFVLMHFGSDIKYLEYELYLIHNLRDNTKHDIIYMYSISDTPNSFVEIVKQYCQVKSINDDQITYNIEYESHYTHFNLLRTCNFIFAYELEFEYKKICIIESDMMIFKNLDSIFELKTPSVLTYYSNNKILTNYEINLEDPKFNWNYECSKSGINGGIMLFEPSKELFKSAIKAIKVIIKHKCVFPNETLFLLINKKIYNLPYIYNATYTFLEKYKNIKDDIYLVHYFLNSYKHIERIKDDGGKWLTDTKFTRGNPILSKFLITYKETVYQRHEKKVNNDLELIKINLFSKFYKENENNQIMNYTLNGKPIEFNVNSGLAKLFLDLLLNYDISKRSGEVSSEAQAKENSRNYESDYYNKYLKYKKKYLLLQQILL
jgi:hypothetical protein